MSIATIYCKDAIDQMFAALPSFEGGACNNYFLRPRVDDENSDDARLEDGLRNSVNGTLIVCDKLELKYSGKIIPSNITLKFTTGSEVNYVGDITETPLFRLESNGENSSIEGEDFTLINGNGKIEAFLIDNTGSTNARISELDLQGARGAIRLVSDAVEGLEAPVLRNIISRNMLNGDNDTPLDPSDDDKTFTVHVSAPRGRPRPNNLLMDNVSVYGDGNTVRGDQIVLHRCENFTVINCESSFSYENGFVFSRGCRYGHVENNLALCNDAHGFNMGGGTVVYEFDNINNLSVGDTIYLGVSGASAQQIVVTYIYSDGTVEGTQSGGMIAPDEDVNWSGGSAKVICGGGCYLTRIVDNTSIENGKDLRNKNFPFGGFYFQNSHWNPFHENIARCNPYNYYYASSKYIKRDNVSVDAKNDDEVRVGQSTRYITPY